jgi:hypothetical protein
MQVEWRNQCERLRNGRWMAGFSLVFVTGAGWIVRQCFDPRIDLTFESEEEARARNRELVGNWKEAQDPEIKLYEWPT